MEAFSDVVDKLRNQLYKPQIEALNQLQTRQLYEPKIEILLKNDELNIKDQEIIEVFGYIVRKKVKLEKEIKFMIKFLDYFRFFKELRTSISYDLYIDTLKKMQFEIVEQNQFICSKSKIKKKNKQQNNFYIVIEGEVMEFQQLNAEQDSSNASIKCQEIQNNLKQKMDFQNNSENQVFLERNSTQNILNTSQDSLYEQNSNRSSRQSSRMNSPSNAVQNSVNRLTQLDQSIKQSFQQFTPKAAKKKDSIAFLDQTLIEEEMAFIRNVNLCLESFKSIGKINQNSKKFLKVADKAINLLKIKNNLLVKPSQLSNFSISRQDSRNTPQLFSKISSQISSKYDVLDDASPFSPYSTDYRNINQDKEIQMIFQIAQHFKEMKLRKILKQGEIFGEFDDGNLNLVEQGYMSKKKCCLVSLSSSVYNDIIEKHQIQSVENKIRFLQQFVFFKSYSKQKMKNYLKYFESATYYRNNILYQELDPSSFIYFITSGEIEFSRLFKLENQNQSKDNEKMVPLTNLNAQDFDLTFNPFEKQEREIYKLNQGKQNKERSQLIKRINSFILGPNQYFGEKEVLANSFRISQAKVLSVKLEVIQLPCYIYYEQFYDQDIHEACLQESHLKEIEEINIYNQIQSRQPYQNIVEKLENDYLKDFIKNNQKDVTKKIDLLVSNLPPQLPIELLKNKKISEVANYKDTYLHKKKFDEMVQQQQLESSIKQMQENRQSKIKFLKKFVEQKSKLKTPVQNLPFYDQIQEYVESSNIKSKQNQPFKQNVDIKIQKMLKFCSNKNLQNPINFMSKQNSFQFNSNQHMGGNQLLKQTQTKIFTEQSYFVQRKPSKERFFSTKIEFEYANFQADKQNKKRVLSAVPAPMTISTLSLNRKQKFKQQQLSNQFEQNQNLKRNIIQIPLIQSVKKVLKRNSFQSETPHSLDTAVTFRTKNISNGSQYSYLQSEFAYQAVNDSIKEDYSLEVNNLHNQVIQNQINQQQSKSRRKTVQSII
ncbi:hypothetical protein ABPG72_014904 [Tetrahymena utriculariae]